MKSRNAPFLHILIMVMIIAGILLLFPITINSTASQLKSWTYPSGYDPHGGYVDQLTFIVYPYEEISQALLALQTGTVYSYDEQIPYQAVSELVANPAIEVTSELGTSYRQFTFNCARFPTNITGYRRALAFGLDKYAAVENARGGFAQPMDNPIPLAFDFWTYETQMASHFYAEDISSANATLDAAHIIDTPDSPHPGWRYFDADMSGTWTEGVDKRGDTAEPDGLFITIWVSAGYDPSIQASLVLLTGMAKCGLMGEIEEAGGWNWPDEFCAGCFSWSISPPGVPSLLYELFHTESPNNRFFYHYNNSEFDYNCTRFMDAPTRLEARNWAWNCCRSLIEDVPMLACYNDEYTHAYRTDIWEGYVNWVSQNRMSGNPYTYQQIRLKESVGGPFGICYPTEYVTVLSEGMASTNTIQTSSLYSQTIFNLIYSTLWRVDPMDPFTGLAPDLAYNWTIQPTIASGDIEEGMRYTFHLYENVSWHDGTPFTAEDVQYSFMTIHSNRWTSYTSGKLSHIYRVDVPNEYTVEIYSNSTGYVDFTESTAVQILPKHIWSSYEAENFTWIPQTSEDLTGTGCYKWINRVVGQYIVLERYAGWHFAIELPQRPPCPPTGSFPIEFVFLIAIIIVESVILGVLLYHRQQRGRLKTT